MICLYVNVPFATFRKSYARTYGETYALPPPATVFGMLLSLVGERIRRRHEGVRLAFAFKRPPAVATTLRKLSRYKYGVPGKQESLGNQPDFIETLCGIEFLCWVDSTGETHGGDADGVAVPTLEQRIVLALVEPQSVDRFGVLSLGLSDDAVDDVRLVDAVDGEWRHLVRSDHGPLDLPVWVDHVGAADTRWQRYSLDEQARAVAPAPPDECWTTISSPIG